MPDKMLPDLPEYHGCEADFSVHTLSSFLHCTGELLRMHDSNYIIFLTTRCGDGGGVQQSAKEIETSFIDHVFQ